MKNKFTIVVSSSDAYEDCWNPFFTLFNKFWPNCEIPIMLVSNTKVFEFENLNITCPIAGMASRNNKWGESFLKTLQAVDTDIILLLMIDYFIKSPVQINVLNELVDLMYRDNITHIVLLSEVPGSKCKTKYPMLLERGQQVPYRFTLQAGLWRKDRLNDYIREYEDPWLGETWGTKRAWHIKESFYCIDKAFEQAEGKIINYHHLGGMRQGKWRKEEVVDLFKQNGVEVDFLIRGFHDDSQIKTLPERLKARLYRFPSEAISWLELYFMTY